MALLPPHCAGIVRPEGRNRLVSLSACSGWIAGQLRGPMVGESRGGSAFGSRGAEYPFQEYRPAGRDDSPIETSGDDSCPLPPRLQPRRGENGLVWQSLRASADAGKAGHSLRIPARGSDRGSPCQGLAGVACGCRAAIGGGKVGPLSKGLDGPGINRSSHYSPRKRGELRTYLR